MRHNNFRKRIIRTVASVIMSFSLVICSGTTSVVTYAATSGTGVIKCSENDWVAARSGPGTNYPIEHKLANGKPITVIEDTKGTDGMTWYKIKYNLIVDNSECISYVRSDLVTITSTSASQPGTASGTVYATASVTANNVFLRDNAGTSGTNKLVSLYCGDKVDIIGEKTVSGVVWYNVNCTKNGTNYTGWVICTYLNVTYTGATDENYAQTLRNSGFPESYINNLSALHTKHPNWTFIAVNTGLDWNTVIANESVNGRNLVQNSENDARKSTAAGAYNWNTNKWTVYDGASWVSANPNYIAYCMDPRNFLDETNIFQFESLSYNASHTTAGVSAILNGTFMSGSVKDADGSSLNYANAFVNIGKSTSVSPYHLAARVKQEQGVKGTSPLISGKYSGFEGYYNYFNYGAYGSSKEVVYKNGLTYAKNKGWNTRYKSLLGGAQLLGANYINKGQDTLYFEKFNVVNHNALYSHQYMANVKGAISEGQSVAKGYTDKNQAFVFKIPVYSNMPEKAVAFSDSGNPNNYLKSLGIAGLSLTPAFNGDTTNYSIVVPNAISSVTVAAEAVASTSSISGAGKYNLSVGNNTIKVNCKSQSGVTRTYTINISRQGDAGNNNNNDNNSNNGSNGNTAGNTYSISSSKYKIGSVITGVAPGTSAATFLANISATGGSVKLLDSAGGVNTGTVGTGNRIALYDSANNLKATYDIVIYGDTSGDGVISVKDLIMINRHILKKSNLSGAALTAADASKDGNVSIKDLILVNNNILGKSTISQ